MYYIFRYGHTMHRILIIAKETSMLNRAAGKWAKLVSLDDLSGLRSQGSGLEAFFDCVSSADIPTYTYMHT